MLPDFTAHGLLPAGIHRATFKVFQKRFAYFDRSDRRYRVFDKLRELYQQAKRSGIDKQFLVAGSFVTAKAEPNDFDCLLILDQTTIGRELRPAEYNIVSRQRARRMFGGDVISVVEQSIDHFRFLAYFQETREDLPVGIVEIEL